MKQRLLLHSCCGPCSIHVAEELQKEYEVSMYYCESNIYPEKEHIKRLNELQKVADMKNIILFNSIYNHDEWKNQIVGLEDEPEGRRRCIVCFKNRLKETAKMAKEMDFDIIATTLTISPHKNADLINELGIEIAEEYDLEYLDSDFKENDGFSKSIKKCKDQGIYTQKYCGCEFSLNK